MGASPARRCLTSPHPPSGARRWQRLRARIIGSGSSGNLGALGPDVFLMPWQVLGHVLDPLKRTWERGVYVGPDATARR